MFVYACGIFIGRNVNSMLSIVLSCVIRVLNRIICLITGSAPVHTSSCVLLLLFLVFSLFLLHSLGLLVYAQKCFVYIDVCLCACEYILFTVYFLQSVGIEYCQCENSTYIKTHIVKSGELL